jgi:hypothetical protein
MIGLYIILGEILFGGLLITIIVGNILDYIKLRRYNNEELARLIGEPPNPIDNIVFNWNDVFYSFDKKITTPKNTKPYKIVDFCKNNYKDYNGV